MAKAKTQTQSGPIARISAAVWRLTRAGFRRRPVVLSLLLFATLTLGVSRLGLLDAPVAALNVASIVWATDTGLVVKYVNFHGLHETKPEVIREVMGITDGMAMHQLDLEGARVRVEKISWVKSATISRTWPNTVLITIVEREPYAIWQIEGIHWLVDAEGHHLSTEAVGRYSHLPFIVGPGAPAKASALIALIGQTPALAERIRAMVRVGERRWDIEFDTGARLRLPEDAASYGMSRAWADFVAMEAKDNLLARDVAIYDFRIEDRVVIRMTPEGQDGMVQHTSGRGSKT